MTGTARALIQAVEVPDHRLLGLTIYIREAKRAGEVPLLQSSTWEQSASGFLNTSVSAKLRLMLAFVHEKTTRAGATIEISHALDHPRFHADESEVPFLLETLLDRGLLARKPGGGGAARLSDGTRSRFGANENQSLIK